MKVGIFVHRINGLDNNFTELATLDASFNGTSQIDINGDYAADGLISTWAAVDCSTITIP